MFRPPLLTGPEQSSASRPQASAPVLHSVELERLRPRHRRRLPIQVVILLGLLAALAVALGLNYRVITQPSPAGAPSAPPAVPAVALDICYSNPTWTPPSADVEGAHLQADQRYRGVDLATASLAHQRVYVESGGYRSASSFGDFITLSGLWSDPGLQSLPCSDDLRTTAELWGLELHFDRGAIDGADLTVYASSRDAGVEVIHVPLPPSAEALHVLDSTGTKIVPDIHVGNY